MIELNSVSKTYYQNKAKQKVLNNISVTFPDKGLVTIVGDSGSGKTTLLNCIGGIERFKGRITIGSFAFSSETKKMNDFRSKNIGYIFQNFCLIEDITVLDNIQLAIDIAKNNEENDRERIKEVLTFVGMEKYIHRKVNTLSGGQKQRIGIARALVNNAKILLCDEPTGHLDSENTSIIMGILKKISRDCLVLLVTHEKNIAEKYSDRTIEICDGTIKNDFEQLSFENTTQDFCLNKTKKLFCKKREGIFKHIFKFTKTRISSIILFIFSAIFLSFSLSFSTPRSDKKINDMLNYPIDSLKIESYNNSFGQRDYEKILGCKYVNDFLPLSDTASFELTNPILIQSNNSVSINLNACLCPLKEMNELVFGRMPTKNFEVIIDEYLCNQLLNNTSEQFSNIKLFGFTSANNFINSHIKYGSDFDYRIVGVSKNKSPCFYLNDNDLFSICMAKELNSPYIYDDPKVVGADFLLGDHDVAINNNEYIIGKYAEKNDEVEILGNVFKIKETYENQSLKPIIMNFNKMKDLFWKNFINSKVSFLVLCNDVESAQNELIEMGYTCLSSKEISGLIYKETKMQGQIVSNIFSIIILISASFVYVLSEKKKINEMIPEISVKRLLGQSKFRILYQFLLEGILTMAFFVLPFFFLTSFIINSIVIYAGSVIPINEISVGKLFLGMGILLGMTSLISFVLLIPFVKKTPASLNKSVE